MLFRKDIPKSCQYCIHGSFCDEGLILCTKKGVVQDDHKCRKFKYDPCKRIPVKAKAMDFSKYNNDDFSL